MAAGATFEGAVPVPNVVGQQVIERSTRGTDIIDTLTGAAKVASQLIEMDAKEREAANREKAVWDRIEGDRKAQELEVESRGMTPIQKKQFLNQHIAQGYNDLEQGLYSKEYSTTLVSQLVNAEGANNLAYADELAQGEAIMFGKDMALDITSTQTLEQRSAQFMEDHPNHVVTMLELAVSGLKSYGDSSVAKISKVEDKNTLKLVLDEIEQDKIKRYSGIKGMDSNSKNLKGTINAVNSNIKEATKAANTRINTKLDYEMSISDKNLI